MVSIISVFWNLEFFFVAKNRYLRLINIVIVFWVAVKKTWGKQMYLPVEFLFFLKNLVTEPHYVSIWIILNDLKFWIDISWNSVITLIRLSQIKALLWFRKKLPPVLSLKLFVLYIWFGIPVTTMSFDGSSLHSKATVFSLSCVSSIMVTCFF